MEPPTARHRCFLDIHFNQRIRSAFASGTTVLVSVRFLCSCAGSRGTSSAQHFHEPGIALFAVNSHRFRLCGHRFHDSSACWGGSERHASSSCFGLGRRKQNTKFRVFVLEIYERWSMTARCRTSTTRAVSPQPRCCHDYVHELADAGIYPSGAATPVLVPAKLYRAL